jgi:prenyltransferase beta subunit
MWSRRQFLSRSGLALLGTAGTSFALPGDGPGSDEETLPDGSASKDMVTKATDEAIERGLKFLAARQHPDGSFGTGGYAGNVAVTSLAAMAFMAGGHQPNRNQYGQAVTKALTAVLAQENRSGGHPGYLHNPRATPHGPMYGHGFGTLFLAEVYGMVHDRDLAKQVHDKLRLAAQLIVSCQNVEGGWRYTPESRDADLSVTVCQIMALRAARNAGVAVPIDRVERCIDYVKRCQNRGEGSFRYMVQGNFGPGQQGFARTAAGVAALNCAGLYKGPEVESGLQYLLRNKPAAGFAGRGGVPDMHYFYGHYYAVQCMWTAGGHYWKDWYPFIRNELLNRQRDDGSWLDSICQHYGTAMACIILQIPNNYLPILQK